MTQTQSYNLMIMKTFSSSSSSCCICCLKGEMYKYNSTLVVVVVVMQLPGRPCKMLQLNSKMNHMK